MTVVDRRSVLAGAVTASLAAASASAAPGKSPPAITPKWDVFEASFKGPRDGNPFRDVELTASFRQGNRSIEVRGFYDGDGVYKVRFMPDTEGDWRFVTTSSAPALNGKTGGFRCVAAKAGVHGPVGVRNEHHFGHADGTPFYPFGTTCYAWIHQSTALQEETLASLAKAPFNKMRMCVFPKSYAYNTNEPELYAFERDASGKNDFTRPDPTFYHHLEKRIGQLQALGIETDLILFHPYDRWGYATMSAADDDAYLRYIVARLSSIRSIWWSLANEYDFLREKTTADWDRMLRLVQRDDPYGRLRSIHYATRPYDYSRSTVTHASMQTAEFTKTSDYIRDFRKPIAYDEVRYEGNVNRRWGNLSGEEMSWRFWRGVVAGGYVTHGETLLDPNADLDEQTNPTLWWSHGGTLKGTSPARIGFLRNLVEQSSAASLARSGYEGDARGYYPNAQTYSPDGKEVTSILYFLDYHQPLWNEFPLPPGDFAAEIIDPWAMTIAPVSGTFSGKPKLKLPAKPYQAVRFLRR